MDDVDYFVLVWENVSYFIVKLYNGVEYVVCYNDFLFLGLVVGCIDFNVSYIEFNV